MPVWVGNNGEGADMPLERFGSAPLNGNEAIYGEGEPVANGTALDFWRWAYSDLCMNNVRGVFAEWLVARLLNLPQRLRDAWAECDLSTEDGITIEVKAGAYLQAWHDQASKPSLITFSRLRGRKWLPDNRYADQQTCNADFYVFCVQIEIRASEWDAFNLSQWRFYVLSKAQVEAVGQGSMGLGRVRSMARELTASEFRLTMGDALEEYRARRLAANSPASACVEAGR